MSSGEGAAPHRKMTCVLDRRLEQWVPGEPAPCFQFKANAFFVSNNRDQIAWAAAAQ